MPRKIALISDHASPLAVTGGVDSGGQDIYVGHVARQGYEVDLLTRRDSPLLEESMHWSPGIQVIHVPAGPPVYVRKEELLPMMNEFAAFVIAFAAPWVKDDVPCRNGYRSICPQGHHDCLRRVAPEVVYAAALELLAEPQALTAVS